MELIYFDNPVVRSLMEIPQTWNDLHDPFIKTFGRRFRPIQSCYLFFEYIGFTKKKLKIPTELKKPTFDHHVELAKVDPDIPATISTEAIALIDADLGSIANAIDNHIAAQMHALQTTFEDLVTSREKRASSFKGAQELQKVLFGDIIDYMKTDFAGFVKYATRYLSWDTFCGINPIGLSLKLIRQRQLGFWLQFWEEGIELPIGKIVDDQVGYYDLEFRSHFKEFEDMVDTEMHTHLIMGSKVNGELHPICAVAYPPHDQQAFEKRNTLILGSITNIETSLQKTVAKRPGKLYQLDPKTHVFQKIFEPIFKIEL